MTCYLVVGATSDIAQACCREWLSDPSNGDPSDAPRFYLLGRDAEKLECLANDLRARGAQEVSYRATDLLEFDTHPSALEGAFSALGTIDVALIAHGTLPNQPKCETDTRLAVREFSLNATVTISLLTLLAQEMADLGRGTIAVITSVAGDRGRPSNYVYGSAKAAVSVFCEGLRARVFAKGVHVIDIRPGFVDTQMTRHLELPSLLVASPAAVARRIIWGIRRRKDVLYVPYFWAFILFLIRNIPAPVFKRMSL
ncbi:MAG: SDR family oxidoreductase [Gammaproteobacteria bacterium]|nr:SDR family oxidoreductase [Gammaproteobacteria bacterium]